MKLILSFSIIMIIFTFIGFRQHTDLWGDIYIGPGNDTLLIDEDFVHDGNIIIFGDGVLLIVYSSFVIFI